MLLALTPTAVPTFVTLPVETLVHEPPVLKTIVAWALAESVAMLAAVSVIDVARRKVEVRMNSESNEPPGSSQKSDMPVGSARKNRQQRDFAVAVRGRPARAAGTSGSPTVSPQP